MKKLIVGYGNVLRQDDGAGVRVVEFLIRDHLDSDCHCLTVPQLTPEIAWELAEAEEAVFVDATAAGEPGEITWTEIVCGEVESPATVHEGTPEHLLALAWRLYGKCPAVQLVTISGEAFDYGETLSPSVRKAIRRVEKEIAEKFVHCVAGCGSGKGCGHA
jgi:hydrogenase maturation protease